MLSRIKELITDQVDFAFETTLATRSYQPLIKKIRAKGYRITMVFFWLESPGLKNLFTLYLRSVDGCMIYNNSSSTPELIAKGENEEILIFNADIWNLIKQ